MHPSLDDELASDMLEAAGMFGARYVERMEKHLSAQCDWDLRNGELWCTPHRFLLFESPYSEEMKDVSRETIFAAFALMAAAGDRARERGIR